MQDNDKTKQLAIEFKDYDIIVCLFHLPNKLPAHPVPVTNTSNNSVFKNIIRQIIHGTP